MTVLQPGDLVNIIVNDGEVKPQVNQASSSQAGPSQVNSNQVNSNQTSPPAVTVPPADRPSVGLAIGRQETGQAVADQATAPH